MPLNKEAKDALKRLVAATILAREAETFDEFVSADRELFAAYQDYRHCLIWEEPSEK